MQFALSFLHITFICFIICSKMSFAQLVAPIQTPANIAFQKRSPTESSALPQTQPIYTTGCDWCNSHFSTCHQPTTAPDSQIFSQCYCDASFQSMYSTCVDNCGWSSAGIPPLASITSSCSNENVEESTVPGQSALPTASLTAPEGGTITTAVVPGSPPTTTGTGTNTNSKGNGNSATSGVNEWVDGHSLLFKFQGVVLAGVAVFWIFG